jgi:hypothetical protein
MCDARQRFRRVVDQASGTRPEQWTSIKLGVFIDLREPAKNPGPGFRIKFANRISNRRRLQPANAKIDKMLVQTAHARRLARRAGL